MDTALITALVGAMTGLMGLFFGKQFWGVTSGLVEDQRKEIIRLQTIVDKVRDRLDKLEDQAHKKDLEILEVSANLDNFVTANQYLSNENQRLTERVGKLSMDLSEAHYKIEMMRDVITTFDPDWPAVIEHETGKKP